MENMNISATDNSPIVTLDSENGIIEFEGKCHPENTFEFFAPILEWLETYFDGNAQENTIINFKLGYFNSVTTQTIFDIFDLILEGTYNNLEVNWYYDKSSKSAYADYEDFSEEFEDLNIKAVPYE